MLKKIIADKGSFSVTAAKARNSVRQTDASVIKQRDFVIAGITAVSVVKIRISQINVHQRCLIVVIVYENA